ncbi:MAG: hypothetical protein WC348_04735 [Patescibacteria group bacterium]|jgi:HD-GYP domain-containing protein (c-di-GMP phosphodiesterase class II)
MDGKEKEFSPEATAEREQFITEQFERANFDIRQYPELFERFKRLHNPPESKHFEDAAQIADIIETIWDELDAELPFKLEKERMILAALLHDVGKSGPKEAGADEQKLIVALFDPSHYEKITADGKNVAGETILHALRDSDLAGSTQQKIAKYLNRLGIDIVNETMLSFWRRHADWTFDVLKIYKEDKIDEKLAIMAASHHILEGKNPAGLNPEDVPHEAQTIEMVETYEILTMVDQFQAYIKRSGKSHKEAVEEVRSKINRQKFSDKVKKEYLVILAIIEKSEGKLQAKLKK